MAKLFERIIYDKLNEFFRNYIIKEQHGFRLRKSVISQMCLFLDDIHYQLDTRHYANIFYADVSKAFDSVNHKLLINKLQLYGITGRALKLLMNYLDGRSHRVAMNNVLSGSLPMTAGVPQGSVLGPFLFIIFINDMINSHKLGQSYIFADDTKVLINSDLNNNLIMEQFINLINWYKDNGLCLNLDKCQLMNLSNKVKPWPYCDH